MKKSHDDSFDLPARHWNTSYSSFNAEIAYVYTVVIYQLERSIVSSPVIYHDDHMLTVSYCIANLCLSYFLV